MTDQEVQWFNTLSEQRRAFREATRQNNFDEIWDVITSPYSDQAHFVYELLQNADDCGASEVEFELTNGWLVFGVNNKQGLLIDYLRRFNELSRAEINEFMIDEIHKDFTKEPNNSRSKHIYSVAHKRSNSQQWDWHATPMESH